MLTPGQGMGVRGAVNEICGLNLLCLRSGSPAAALRRVRAQLLSSAGILSPIAMNPKSVSPDKTTPRRVLIVLFGAIGDVVRAMPLLGRLRRAWPQTHIAWAVEPKSAPLLDGHPWLDEAIVFERSRAPWSVGDFVRRLRARRFDLVLDLQRHLKSGVVSLLTGAPARLGFSRANAKELNHLFSNRWISPQPPMRLKLLQFQSFADALGLDPAPIEFGLQATRAQAVRAEELLAGAPRPLLGVILGSSWPSRFYFPEAVGEVVRSLSERADGAEPLFPVLLGGPHEADFAAQVTAHLDGKPVLNLVNRTTLRDLVAIFERCAVAFGPDSGPMHIAAAVGCPVVSLWGATAPQRSAPWGYAQFALAGEIPCHPCYLRNCPVGRQCMRRIAPEQVAAMIRAALSAKTASGAVGTSGVAAAGAGERPYDTLALARSGS